MNEVIRLLEKVGAEEEQHSAYAGPYPLALNHRVVWGDCDPAGIIYTPRVLDYAMETLEKWYVEVLQVPWMKLNREMDMGAPTVRAEIDFLDAPAPGDEIVSELRVEAVGGSSVTYMVAGHDGGERQFYRCKIISCFVARPEFRATPVPDSFRERIDAYRKGCGEI
jgi:4-hydroxybenzoyl-CoA thioesterase